MKQLKSKLCVCLHVHQVSDLLPKSSVQSEVFAYYNFDDDMDANDTMKKLKE